MDDNYCTDDQHLEREVIDLATTEDGRTLWCTACNKEVES
jgi:hypothetical protein